MPVESTSDADGRKSKRPNIEALTQSASPQPENTQTVAPSTPLQTSPAPQQEPVVSTQQTQPNANPSAEDSAGQTKRTRSAKPKPLLLNGEILKGIMTLDNGLKLTAAPYDGFPIPQLGESVWRNIPADIQTCWSQKPGAKAWVRLFRARFEENAQSTVAKLRNVITQLIGSQRATNLLISPPTAEEPIYQRFAPPWHFLVSGIPVEAIELLTSLTICATVEVTCIFVQFEQPAPTYICTIENFTFQDSDKSNLLIAKIVQDTLRECPEIVEFIYHHIPSSNSLTVTNALNSIRVTSMNIAISKSESLTVWNVYCDNPPNFSLEDFFMWAALIRGLRFPSDDYGTGLPRLNDRQFVCVGCKSLDHPTGLCPLPNIPGWLGPSSTSPKEDLSMTTFDARRHGPSGDTKTSARGTNRGRGIRGRGSSRGGRGSPHL